GQVLDGDRAYRAVELRVSERQARAAVHVVDDGSGELRVLGHLLRIHSQSHHFAKAKIRGQVAAPAAHQIEHSPPRGQQLGVQAAERGNCSLVDVDDLARKAVELVVWRFVVSRVGLGRKQIVTFPGVVGSAPSVGRQVYA